MLHDMSNENPAKGELIPLSKHVAQDSLTDR